MLYVEDETILLENNITIIKKHNFTDKYNGRVNRDDLDGSDISHIKYIMIHYTVSCEYETLNTFKYTEVSAHYVINKDGNILNIVPDRFRAWHAGVGNLIYPSLLNHNYENIKNDMNSFSIGIEIVNSGFEEYTNQQCIALYQLLKYLSQLYNICPLNIIGHNVWAIGRKIDPGIYWQDLRDYIWKQQKIDNQKILHEITIENMEEKSQQIMELDIKVTTQLLQQFRLLGICQNNMENIGNLINGFKLFYSYPKLYQKNQLTLWTKLDQIILDILCDQHNK